MMNGMLVIIMIWLTDRFGGDSAENVRGNKGRIE